MNRTLRLLLPAVAALVLAPGPSSAYLVSVTSDQMVDGQLFNNGDLFSYEPGSGEASLYLAESTLFVEDVDLNAASFLPNGNLVFSIANDAGALAAGVLVGDGDLAEYDAASGSVSIYLPQSVYGTNVDVDAAHVLEDGRVLVSFRRDETIQDVLYRDGDVIAYDPSDGSFSVFFPESSFVDQNVDIDAFAVTRDGTYLISTRASASLGGADFNDVEVVEYDPASGVAQVIFAVSGGGSDVNALAQLPPPACADGLDNDGDGYVDLEDPVCFSSDWGDEFSVCQDGLDNDFDGGVDFDGGASIHGAEAAGTPDSYCTAASIVNEQSPSAACGSGFQAAFVLPALVGLRRLRRARR